MRVARLELFGFKSFMEKLVLPLEGGITGVVGPNGCGKSNVVDAIRWVLGETRAKTLRGDTLEDVIFNGTEKHRPLGLAEVSLTLRAAEANFFADLRSEKLEAEAIAGLAVLDGAKDVAAEAPAGADVPEEEKRPTLSVIQGNKDSAEPIVQAESVSAGDAQPAPGLTKEEDKSAVGSHTLLQRFSWLQSVNEVQLTRRLYRSGESEYFMNRVPCRLSDLKELFRAVGLGARAYTIVAQGEVSRIVTAKPEEVRLILEEAAGVLGFRDKIAAAHRRLEETATNISRFDDIIKEVTRQVSSLKRQATRAINRKQLKDDLHALDKAISSDSYLEIEERAVRIQQELQEAQGAEARAAAASEAVQAEEQEARNAMMSVDVESDAIRSKVDSIREELNTRARARSEKQSRINELRAFAGGRIAEIKRLEERRQTLTTRLTECEGQIEQLKKNDAEILEKLKGVDVSASEDELKSIAARLNDCRQKLRTKDQELRTVRDELISSQSRLRAAQEQLIAASPMNQMKKTLGGDAAAGLSSVVGGATLFVDGLKVPSKYARAVQSLIAERAQFLVADDPKKIAHFFVDQALSRDPSNKKGLGLGIFKKGNSDGVVVGGDLQLTEQYKLLRNEIQVEPGFSLAADQILAQVVVAGTLAEAFAFFEQAEAIPARRGATIVTLDGDILTHVSFYSLRHDSGLVQLKNKIEELSAVCADREVKQKELTTTREEIQKEISQAEQKHSEVLRESQRRQAMIRELSNQQGNIRGRLHAELRLLEQQKQDTHRIGDQIKDCESKIVGFQNEEKLVEEALKAMVSTDEEALKTELQTLQGKSNQLEAVRRDGRAKLAQSSQKVYSTRQELDRARAKVSDRTLGSQRIVLERDNLHARVRDLLGGEFFDALVADATAGKCARLSNEARQQASSEATKIRERIAREGDVDPDSIRQLEEETKRCEEITAQREDLQRAAHTLERTIEKLNDTSVERFIATFNEVRDNFARLIPRLFGGGKGSLELIDPTKPLETGVQIVVRPPGKKINSIELLSGGEKALCAIGLIFSMFLVRPSPLCVLDEVDAPLDEANLVRYLSMVKEMSARTQFLMITHNKQSMASAANLVGVTMQEPGASKVITVSLEEAYKQVA